MRVGALVLAAGGSARFGSPKALARLDGRPLLQHVLDAVAETPLEPVLVILGQHANEIERAIPWRSEIRLRNPDPARGLSSSLRDGLAALGAFRPAVDAVVILLGDQPLTRADVVAALLAAADRSDKPVLAPRYAEGGGPNPLLVRRAAFAIADESAGDRGLGPVVAARPELVGWVDVGGSNPDVDTPPDLAALAEAAWAARVRANREQVDRLREVADPTDFYAPVSSLFRADPHRTDEPLLDELRSHVQSGETWLDIGAGAGRYALPLAAAGARVIALDVSPGMLDALREDARENGIDGVETVEGRWPPDEALRAKLGRDPLADVALIAHVSYDIEPIGAFLDAMEAAARRLCVAILQERQPSSLADACWPPVHGEARVPLPALPEFLDLLRARGRDPEVRRAEREPRRFGTRDELEGFLRRQLWIADGGEKERRFRDAVGRIVVEEDGRFGVAGQRPLPVGLVTWEPRH